MTNLKLERSKFLNDLLAEVDAFDEGMFPPNQSKMDGDIVVGECPLWVRKAFALDRYYARECKRHKVEREFESADESKNHDNGCRYMEMTYKKDLLHEILWAAIRGDMNLWADHNVGLREGWIVVRSKAEPQDQIRNMIQGLFGGNE